MVKLINGRLWYCCPACGQKLHQIAANAVCIGVTTHCRRCGWEGEMNIEAKKGA